MSDAPLTWVRVRWGILVRVRRKVCGFLNRGVCRLCRCCRLCRKFCGYQTVFVSASRFFQITQNKILILFQTRHVLQGCLKMLQQKLQVTSFYLFFFIGLIAKFQVKNYCTLPIIPEERYTNQRSCFYRTNINCDKPISTIVICLRFTVRHLMSSFWIHL